MRSTLLISGFLFLCISCNQSATQTENSKRQYTKEDTARTQSVNAHHSFTEEINNLPPSIARFVPTGYTAIDTTSGDLNLDTYPDMILVLKKKGEETTSDLSKDKPEKRPLIILTGQPGETYKLEKRNDNVVLCIDCGGTEGDPFTGIAIKKGYFSVEHGIAGGAHRIQIITFKYNRQKLNWFLHQDGSISYKFNDSTDDNAEALVKDNENIKRQKDFGVISFDQYDVYKEAAHK